MYVDNVESMVGAEKRRNIPYDENAMYIAAGVQVLNLVGTSEGGGVTVSKINCSKSHKT